MGVQLKPISDQLPSRKEQRLQGMIPAKTEAESELRLGRSAKVTAAHKAWATRFNALLEPASSPEGEAEPAKAAEPEKPKRGKKANESAAEQVGGEA